MPKSSRRKKPNSSAAYTLYILKCADGTLYTGITNNLPKRLAAHKNGTGAKYTRSHPPEKIIYTAKFKTKGGALSQELKIKSLAREEKIRLISRSKS